jgi:sucrose-6-phosphate hydrolase SacC (GH32 family)
MNDPNGPIFYRGYSHLFCQLTPFSGESGINYWGRFVSPCGKAQYFVGDFDAVTWRFHPRKHGFLGYASSFYAPNTMQIPDGRLVWSWLNGFPAVIPA